MAYTHNGLGQNGCGSGAVTGLVVGLGGHLFHHLGAHVLEGVFQLYFLGYGYTVLGNLGSAELLGYHHIAALGAQGYLHSIGEGIGTAGDGGAHLCIEFDFFCHNQLFL